MAVNGIRVSALPVMEVADLTDGDYLIVNDENTNTRRISFVDFISAVNVNVADLDVVTSVNTQSGAVVLTAAQVGAADIFQLNEVKEKADSALDITGAQAILLSAEVELRNQQYTAQTIAIAGQGNNISTNTVDIAQLVANADAAGAAYYATVAQGVLATSALQEGAANLLYAEIGSPGNTVNGNASNIATNTAAIAALANGSADLDKPSINGVVVTASGTDLNQLTDVTLGSAAAAATTDFAPAAVTGVDGDAAKAALDIAAALTLLKVNYVVGDLPAEVEIVAAINATNAKINALIAALEIS